MIKKNKKIVFGIIALVLFIAAIPFMAMKAISISMPGLHTILYGSVFAFIFGGSYYGESNIEGETKIMEGGKIVSSPLLIVVFILLIITIIILILMVFLVFSKKK